MIKVVVDRKKWLRGKGDLNSALLLKNGKMCCIGFLARVLNYKPKGIRGICILEDTAPVLAEQQKFIDENMDALSDAYGINDDMDITDTVREKELRRIGKEMGVRFVFKN